MPRLSGFNRPSCEASPADQSSAHGENSGESVSRSWCVRVNAKLRDMNVEVRADDERAIEVLASGLPIHQLAQLAVDITLRSPLTSTGLARPAAATTDGAVLVRARADKEAKYFELLQGNRCHLVVVGLETGGRWSTEATIFVDMLAAGRARAVPSVLRRSTHLAQVDEDAGSVMWPFIR